MISVCAASTDEKSVGAPVRLEEAVDDRCAAVGRQVERQAVAAERLADLREHLLGAGLARVDLVDRRSAGTGRAPSRTPSCGCVIASTPLTALTTITAVSTASSARRAAAEKVGIARRVDDVDAPALRSRSRRSRRRARCSSAFSWGSKSQTVVPRASDPLDRIAPGYARARLRPAASCPRLLDPRARCCVMSAVV